MMPLPDIHAIPDVLEQPLQSWQERLPEPLEGLPGELATRTLRLAASSEFAASVIERDWSWFRDNVATFNEVADDGALELFERQARSEPVGVRDAMRRLRRLRNRTMLRILWREQNGCSDLAETLKRLSILADGALKIATVVAVNELNDRYGRVISNAGTEVPLVIIGMGKLGGSELNFSSDIDLVFSYAADGATNGSKSVSAQEYFARLVRSVVALMEEPTADGFVFRVDTRLRPFGDSGPPVVSFAALESYLQQHGRDWERYAWLKARIVGADPGSEIRRELEDDIIRPFVYRRYLDYGVFESLRDMHQKIAVEVQRRELRDNVKLGPGGIREAEFVVQALQLVRGGSDESLQGRELQVVLPKLVGRRGLDAESAAELLEAYRFLRRLENAIQALHDHQSHDLPDNDADWARLCVATGFADRKALLQEFARHRRAVSRQFAAVAFRGRDAGDDSGRYAALWSSPGSTNWQSTLEGHDEETASSMATLLENFETGSALQQTDAISRDRLQRFLPRLLVRLQESQRPAIGLQRCLAVVEGVLRRSAYLSLLNENDTAMGRFVDLCERSGYIATQLARHPVLLDELLDVRAWTEAVTKSELADDLADRLAGCDDSELRIRLIAQFQRATIFRIAVADFNGRLPIMKVSDGLTWLAEAVLDEALRVATQDLAARHGAPVAGFGIVGYGKLGGLELSYGSDLDIVFLHSARAGDTMTDGANPLETTMFFSRLVRRLVHCLTTQTGSGELYEVDTRLRPEGNSGLLVSSVDGFEKYQEENAWTWEHQALLRARPVAGDATIAAEFERIRRETLMRRVRRDTLKADVVSMRDRMRGNLDRSTPGDFDLKHGYGGIGDIEFLVQFLVLREAREHPAVIEYSDNIRQLDALVASGIVPAAIGAALQEAYRRYRLRLHHLALDDRPALVPANEFEPERDLVTDAWRRWLG